MDQIIIIKQLFSCKFVHLSIVAFIPWRCSRSSFECCLSVLDFDSLSSIMAMAIKNNLTSFYFLFFTGDVGMNNMLQ